MPYEVPAESDDAALRRQVRWTDSRVAAPATERFAVAGSRGRAVAGRLPGVLSIFTLLVASEAFAQTSVEATSATEAGASEPLPAPDAAEDPADPPRPVAPVASPGSGPDRGHAPQDRELARERNPWLGGFGFFAPGILVGNFGDIDRALGSDTALGEGGAPPPVAITVGGGGGFLLGGVYVVRGKGFYYFTPGTPTARGRTTYMGGGGGFDVGLVLYNRKRWLLYPYVGLGGLSAALEVENRHEQTIDIAGLGLAPGEKTELSSGYYTFELGFAFQRLMFEKPSGAMKGNGGFINGGEVGLLVSFHQSEWQHDDDTLRGMPPARMLGFYFRLLMGGGGFSRWEAPKLGRRLRRNRK